VEEASVDLDEVDVLLVVGVGVLDGENLDGEDRSQILAGLVEVEDHLGKVVDLDLSGKTLKEGRYPLKLELLCFKKKRKVKKKNVR